MRRCEPIRDKILHVVACAAGCAALLALSPFARAQAPVVLDRVVAVVNGRVILLSDVDADIELSAIDPSSGGEGPPTPRQALGELISRTLIQQQIRQEDLQSVTPSAAEVQARIEQIRKELPACVQAHCGAGAGWKNFLSAHQLTEARVNAYVRNRMEILRFIEQRFRQGIQITRQQIETYYEKTLLPQYPKGVAPPPLSQVSARIQEILLEQEVNQLFGNWLDNLRSQGDVEIIDPALESAQAKTTPGGGDE